MSFAGASCSCNTVLSVRIEKSSNNKQIGPACQRHVGVIFADVEIDYDKLAAAILRQQQQQQPFVVPDAAMLNPSEQERGASSSNTRNF